MLTERANANIFTSAYILSQSQPADLNNTLVFPKQCHEFQVDAEMKPTNLGPPSTAHFHVLADTPSGLQPIGNPPARASVVSGAVNGAVTKKELPEESGASDKKEEGGGNGTTPELGEFGLRTDQYGVAATYGSSKSSGGAAGRAKDWSDQETLLLLEGLEMYRDDWNKVRSWGES